MTLPSRIWIWPHGTGGTGNYSAEPHRPLDDKAGPTGAKYVPAEVVADLLEALEDIADGMGETELVEIGRYAPHVARAAIARATGK